MPRVYTNRSGFTLLELVVALSLSVALLAAAGGVLNLASGKAKLLQARADRVTWKRHLRELLDQDLKNSRSIAMGKNSLRLEGYHFQQSGRSCLGDAQVIYQIVRTTDSWRLVRKLMQGRRQLQTQLIDQNIQYLKIDGLDSQSTSDEMPRTISVRLFDADREEVLLAHIARY